MRDGGALSLSDVAGAMWTVEHQVEDEDDHDTALAKAAAAEKAAHDDAGWKGAVVAKREAEKQRAEKIAAFAAKEAGEQ